MKIDQVCASKLAEEQYFPSLPLLYVRKGRIPVQLAKLPQYTNNNILIMVTETGTIDR